MGLYILAVDAISLRAGGLDFTTVVILGLVLELEQVQLKIDLSRSPC